PARRSLGDTRVAQLWGEGRRLGQDEAAALALENTKRGMPVPAPRPAGHDTGGHRLPARPVTPPSTLTQREHEITRLVARGLSNKSIAEELVISPATVARHITNILTKLGFTSRAQIAAWSVDNDRP
ncbi:response regulator transcription factor, partial [Actinocorallia lasiicapitis]